MTVYADILVLTNLYIDFFLLLGVKKFLHLRVRGVRLVLGALLGAFASLTSLLPIGRGMLLFLGVLTAAAVTAAAFAPRPAWMLMKAALAFWALSFGLAGFFLFLITFFAPRNIAVVGSSLYFDLSPLMLFGFTCAAYAVITLFRRFFPRSTPGVRYCRLRVEQDGKTAELFAKADTGNNLREPFSALPVIVAQADALGEAAPQAARDYLETGTAQGGLRLIPFDAMGGSGLLPAFQPQKITLQPDGVPLDCWVALYKKPLSAGQFNALINPDLFPDDISFVPKGGPS